MHPDGLARRTSYVRSLQDLFPLVRKLEKTVKSTSRNDAETALFRFEEIVITG